MIGAFKFEIEPDSKPFYEEGSPNDKLIDDCANLLTIAHQDPEGVKNRKKGLLDSSYLSYMINSDEKIITVASYIIRSVRYLDVTALGTHPDYQRRGYATSIVKESTNIIIEKEAEIAGVMTIIESVDGFKTFQNLGFTPKHSCDFENDYLTPNTGPFLMNTEEWRKINIPVINV